MGKKNDTSLREKMDQYVITKKIIGAPWFGPTFYTVAPPVSIFSESAPDNSVSYYQVLDKDQ